MTKTTEPISLIGEALKAYGMTGAECVILRHNENITCKIRHNAKDYVLRIHQPAEGFHTSLITFGHDEISLFRSEAELLLYLSRNGFDGLQTPIPNRMGETVTTLSEGIPAMLLTWIEGRPIAKEEGHAYARQIGKLACQIHRASQGFSGSRFRYDNALCDRMIREIETAVRLNHIPESAGRICIRELEAVKRVQSRIAGEKGNCLIHSDLGFGNILIAENGLVPIDFSLAGYGSLMQEAGMALSNYHDEESCRELLEGFAECGEEIARTDADLFLSYSVLLFICSQHERVYAEEWFGDALDRWCGELLVHG